MTTENSSENDSTNNNNNSYEITKTLDFFLSKYSFPSFSSFENKETNLKARESDTVKGLIVDNTSLKVPMDTDKGLVSETETGEVFCEEGEGEGDKMGETGGDKKGFIDSTFIKPDTTFKGNSTTEFSNNTTTSLNRSFSSPSSPNRKQSAYKILIRNEKIKNLLLNPHSKLFKNSQSKKSQKNFTQKQILPHINSLHSQTLSLKSTKILFRQILNINYGIKDSFISDLFKLFGLFVLDCDDDLLFCFYLDLICVKNRFGLSEFLKEEVLSLLERYLESVRQSSIKKCSISRVDVDHVVGSIISNNNSSGGGGSKGKGFIRRRSSSNSSIVGERGSPAEMAVNFNSSNKNVMASSFDAGKATNVTASDNTSFSNNNVAKPVSKEDSNKTITTNTVVPTARRLSNASKTATIATTDTSSKPAIIIDNPVSSGPILAVSAFFYRQPPNPSSSIRHDPKFTLYYPSKKVRSFLIKRHSIPFYKPEMYDTLTPKQKLVVLAMCNISISTNSISKDKAFDLFCLFVHEVLGLKYKMNKTFLKTIIEDFCQIYRSLPISNGVSMVDLVDLCLVRDEKDVIEYEEFLCGFFDGFIKIGELNEVSDVHERVRTHLKEFYEKASEIKRKRENKVDEERVSELIKKHNKGNSCPLKEPIVSAKVEIVAVLDLGKKRHERSELLSSFGLLNKNNKRVLEDDEDEIIDKKKRKGGVKMSASIATQTEPLDNITAAEALHKSDEMQVDEVKAPVVKEPKIETESVVFKQPPPFKVVIPASKDHNTKISFIMPDLIKQEALIKEKAMKTKAQLVAFQESQQRAVKDHYHKSLQEKENTLKESLSRKQNLQREIQEAEQEVASIRNQLDYFKNNSNPTLEQRVDSDDSMDVSSGSEPSVNGPVDSWVKSEFITLLNRLNLDLTSYDLVEFKEKYKYDQLLKYFLFNHHKYPHVLSCFKDFNFHLLVYELCKYKTTSTLNSLFIFRNSNEKGIKSSLCIYESTGVCQDSECRNLHLRDMLLDGNIETEELILLLMRYFVDEILIKWKSDENISKFIGCWVNELKNGRWKYVEEPDEFAGVLYHMCGMYLEVFGLF